MILAFIIGCLTPETFTSQYGLALCAGIEECGAEVPEGLYCPDPPDLPPMECEEWDEDGARACLDAVESSCGTVPVECRGMKFCQ